MLRHVGTAAALLALPLGAASQHNHPPQPAPADSTRALAQGMAERMQAMQEMMHEMHCMMTGMHGEPGGSAARDGAVPGMCMMHGRRREMAGAGSAACSFGSLDLRLSALLAGPVEQLSVSEAQWAELVRILEAAETRALQALTAEQRAWLEGSRTSAGACPVGEATR